MGCGTEKITQHMILKQLAPENEKRIHYVPKGLPTGHGYFKV